MYPVLHAYCVVQRRSNYYVINIALPLFLIATITFAIVEYGFADQIDSLASRLDVSLGKQEVSTPLLLIILQSYNYTIIPVHCTGLLLTAVAFKYTISEDLPSISYLTALDQYFFVCFTVLILS